MKGNGKSTTRRDRPLNGHKALELPTKTTTPSILVRYKEPYLSLICQFPAIAQSTDPDLDTNEGHSELSRTEPEVIRVDGGVRDL